MIITFQKPEGYLLSAKIHILKGSTIDPWQYNDRRNDKQKQTSKIEWAKMPYTVLLNRNKYEKSM